MFFSNTSYVRSIFVSSAVVSFHDVPNLRKQTIHGPGFIAFPELIIRKYDGLLSNYNGIMQKVFKDNTADFRLFNEERMKPVNELLNA